MSEKLRSVILIPTKKFAGLTNFARDASFYIQLGDFFFW